ncbi:MAG: cysteine desulfurase [Firmicutes bacterium]|nr:cysteine desulfurase [Bacillota bacterium]
MKKESGRIYLDHAATTPVRETVLQAMLPFFGETFGNPMSLYMEGQTARNAVETARKKIADLAGAAKEEIVFTGSGTEADNWAILGGSALAGEGKRHIVTTAIEHHAVLEPCRFLQQQGYDITYVRPDASGLIRPEDVLQAVRDDTCLVSCMMVNNETGAIMPVEKIGEALRDRHVLFHVDAVQALGKLPIDLSKLPVDLMSFSAHKIGGPKGIGALYIRRGLTLPPLLRGGVQERGRRAGTENVPSIVGFGEAAALAKEELADLEKHLLRLRRVFVQGIEDNLDQVRFHGAAKDPGGMFLPGIINISFEGIQAESLLILLDMHGISVSSGSACMSGAGQASHVLSAMGLETDEIESSLRFSFGAENTEEEMASAAAIVSDCVKRLRSLS